MVINFGLIIEISIFVLFFDNGAFGEDTFARPQKFASRTVYRYQSVTSYQFQHYTVPERTSLVSWKYTASIKHTSNTESCQHVDIHIYLQSRRYPLINPSDGSMNEDIIFDGSVLHYAVSSGKTATINVTSPESADWYAIFIYYTDDTGITPQMFQSTCSYQISTKLSWLTVEEPEIYTLYNIQPLTHNVLDTSIGYIYYRLLMPSSVSMVNTTISNCTSSNYNTVCPIHMFGKSMSFPTESSLNASCGSSNTSSSQGCSLIEVMPPTDQWWYIRLEFTQSHVSLNYTIVVSLTYCEYARLPLSPGVSDCTDARRPVTIDDTPSNPATFHDLTLDGGNIIRSVSDLNTTLLNPLSALDTGTCGTFLTGPVAVSLDLGQSDTPSLHLFQRPLRNEGYEMESASCVAPATARRHSSGDLSTAIFLFEDQDGLETGILDINTITPAVVIFYLENYYDLAAVLYIHANFLYREHSFVRTVTLCLTRDTQNPLPSTQGTQLSCERGYLLELTLGKAAGRIVLPWPSYGNWYISATAVCYTEDRVMVPCSNITSIAMAIYTGVCIDFCNYPNGVCKRIITGNIIYSGCSCNNGYRGIDCSDGTTAESPGQKQLEIIVLSLSHIFFIIPIIISAHRRLFVESLTYLLTMLASCTYHLCDCEEMYCFVEFSLMQYMDFLMSMLSFWVTLLSMCEFNSYIKPCGVLIGTLGCAMCIGYDIHSIFAIIPICVGLLLTAVCWIYRGLKFKTCYPSKRRWPSVIAGIALASGGLSIYTFFETETNYFYLHSMWHILMAISIALLLPPGGVKSSAPSSSGSSDNVNSSQLTDLDDPITRLAPLAELDEDFVI